MADTYQIIYADPPWHYSRSGSSESSTPTVRSVDQQDSDHRWGPSR